MFLSCIYESSSLVIVATTAQQWIVLVPTTQSQRLKYSARTFTVRFPNTLASGNSWQLGNLTRTGLIPTTHESQAPSSDNFYNLIKKSYINIKSILLEVLIIAHGPLLVSHHNSLPHVSSHSQGDQAFIDWMVSRKFPPVALRQKRGNVRLRSYNLSASPSPRRIPNRTYKNTNI